MKIHYLNYKTSRKKLHNHVTKTKSQGRALGVQCFWECFRECRVCNRPSLRKSKVFNRIGSPKIGPNFSHFLFQIYMNYMLSNESMNKNHLLRLDRGRLIFPFMPNSPCVNVFVLPVFCKIRGSLTLSLEILRENDNCLIMYFDFVNLFSSLLKKQIVY